MNASLRIATLVAFTFLGACTGSNASQSEGAPDAAYDASPVDSSFPDGSEEDLSDSSDSAIDVTTSDSSVPDSSDRSEDSTEDSAPDTTADSDGSSPDSLDNVLTHHKNLNRDGHYVQPKLTKANVASSLHQDTAFGGSLPDPNDHVYSQPLFIDGGPHGVDMLIVATQANNVYALDASSGVQLWKKNLGLPVALAKMPCGNIDPVGVTGTPVVDLVSRTLWVNGLTTSDNGLTKRHQLFALSIDSGEIRQGWPVDIGVAASSAGKLFDPRVQGQRGALALVGNTVYVPYGGLYGDCGTYHGWVVAVSTDDPAHAQFWSTSAVGGGVWMPGGIASDGTTLFVTTGNTFATSTWAGGDAVIELPTAPDFSTGTLDYFAPKNWKSLDAADIDLGTSPILFNLPGATPSDLVLVLGKDSNAYLLDRGNLGGVSSALAQVVAAKGEIISAPALYSTAAGTYAVFKGDCLSGKPHSYSSIKIVPGSPPTLQTAWCAGNGTGSPMVTTTDGSSDAIVWLTGAEADGLLTAVDGNTGEPISFPGHSVTISGMRRYNAPIAAKGRIYVPADGKVTAFAL